MIAALIVVANVLVVFTSIVFQFWKKLFAVVMSPAVGVVIVDHTILPFRYLELVGVPVAASSFVPILLGATVIDVPISLIPIA
jgi:hypothetical protein